MTMNYAILEKLTTSEMTEFILKQGTYLLEIFGMDTA
jgi:hypothetical protein